MFAGLLSDNKRKLALAIIVVVIFMVVIGILFLLTPRMGEAKLSAAFSGNMYYTEQLDDRTIYFYSGSAFATYNIESGVTTPLTSIQALPKDVRSVKWTKDYALWQAAGYSKTDALYDRLAKNGLDKMLPYWWLVNFETDKMTLVGSQTSGLTVVDALWQDEKTLAYTQTIKDTPDKLSVHRASVDGSTEELLQIASVDQLFAATKDVILYGRYDKEHEKYALVKYDLASKQESTPIADKLTAGVLDVNQNGVIIAALVSDDHDSEELVHTDSPGGELVAYDPSNDKVQKIEDYFEGSAVWHPGGNGWTAVGSNDRDYLTIRGVGDKITKLRVINKTYTTYSAIGYNPTENLDIIADINGNLIYSGETDSGRIPYTTSTTVLGNSVYKPEFYMIYSKPENLYNIYIRSGSNKAGVEAAVKYLEDNGISPYQIKTRWYGNGSPDLSR